MNSQNMHLMSELRSPANPFCSPEAQEPNFLEMAYNVTLMRHNSRASSHAA